MARVLILSPVNKGSGNYASVCRFRGHLQKHGFKTELASPDQIGNDLSYFRWVIQSKKIDLILGVHAYKAGWLLRGSPVPYILVLGGTDVNVDSEEFNKMEVMTEAIKKAGHVVAFSQEMMGKFFKFWPGYDRQKTSVIPQAVTVEPYEFDFIEHVRLKLRDFSMQIPKCGRQPHDQKSCDQGKSHDQLEPYTDMKIFIIVGGIRVVKNPMFLMKEFSEWREENRQDCFLVFVGPNMDRDYFDEFKKETKRWPGVLHLDRLSPEKTHTAIRDSFALVNSSDSEGMSLAILEAMCFGTPVVVRNIPGNTAMVKDGSNGLVFNTPKEFLEKIESLLADQSLVKKLTSSAQAYISQHHSLEKEETAYVSIVEKLLEKNGHLDENGM